MPHTEWTDELEDQALARRAAGVTVRAASHADDARTITALTSALCGDYPAADACITAELAVERAAAAARRISETAHPAGVHAARALAAARSFADDVQAAPRRARSAVALAVRAAARAEHIADRYTGA